MSDPLPLPQPAQAEDPLNEATRQILKASPELARVLNFADLKQRIARFAEMQLAIERQNDAAPDLPLRAGG